MEYFAVITLVLIFIIITHLHNWGVRSLIEDDINGDSGFFVFLFTISIVVFYVILLNYIIKWGINLI